MDAAADLGAAVGELYQLLGTLRDEESVLDPVTASLGLDSLPALIADAALDRGPGVVVVVPGGPADIAGIRAGDVLLAVNGTAVPREEGLELWRRALALTPPGTSYRPMIAGGIAALEGRDPPQPQPSPRP